jgi:hypothetical protein
MLLNHTEIYIFSDQPTVCPKCSARTKLILNLSHTKYQTQIHKCMDENCNFEFIIQSDFDIENELIL